MALIDDAEVAVDGYLVAHLERVAVQLSKFVVDIDLETVTADHTDFTETYRGNSSMGCGSATGRQQTVAAENHANVLRNGIGAHQNDVTVGILLTQPLDLVLVESRKSIHRSASNAHSVTQLMHLLGRGHKGNLLLLRLEVLVANLEDVEVLGLVRLEGEQKRNGYKNMILLYHHFVNEEKDYLDFVVKLTIGVMTGGKHVQYCVNKIEVQ